MGNKNVKGALTYTKYSYLILIGHLVLVILPLFLLREYIVDFFAVEEDVR